MTRLLVPAWHYRGCAVVERVWGWSPVEEAVLLYLRRTPGSGEDLATALAVPRQVAGAAVERLMRHGLIELRLGDAPAFVLSPSGSAAVQTQRPLPERTERRELGISLVYERLGESVLRYRDARWRPYETAVGDALVIDFPPNDPVETFATMEERAWGLVRQSLRTGEVERAIRTTDARISRGYLEIDLENARAGVLPNGASEKLKDSVGRILKSGKVPRLAARSKHGPAPDTEIETTFHPDQFVLGGAVHLERFEAIVDAAREDVFVLSTFVAGQDDQMGRGSRERLWSALDRAVGRGVRCHLFFGTSEREAARHAEAIEDLRLRLVRAARSREHVLAHHGSVRTHAKLLAADDGAGGAVVVLGSCNWLQSPFRAFEMSLELRAGEVVARGLDLFAQTIACSLETMRSIDVLRAMAGEIRRWRTSAFTLEPGKPEEVGARMRIVHAHEHDPLLRRVAHERPGRVMCASARLGANMVPAIFNPLQESRVDLGEAYVLYSRYGGPTKKKHVRAAEARTRGAVKTLGLKDPQLHAKFLLWGDDDVVVTSMNWGSQQGDTAAANDELGLHVSAPGAAQRLLDALRSHLPLLERVVP